MSWCLCGAIGVEDDDDPEVERELLRLAVRAAATRAVDEDSPALMAWATAQWYGAECRRGLGRWRASAADRRVRAVAAPVAIGHARARDRAWLTSLFSTWRDDRDRFVCV